MHGIHLRWNCNDGTSPAFYAPHHARMAHGGSYSNGYVQWRTFELRNRRVCHGEPVCDRYHRRLHRTPADARIFVVLGSCHFGNIIEYDTVTNLSWSVDARTHAIAQMVDRILSEPWAAANELGLEVPPLKRQDDCLVSLRVPGHNIEVFSHWCCCRIATNGTLEIIAYDIRDAHTTVHASFKSITTVTWSDTISNKLFEKGCS